MVRVIKTPNLQALLKIRSRIYRGTELMSSHRTASSFVKNNNTVKRQTSSWDLFMRKRLNSHQTRKGEALIYSPDHKGTSSPVSSKREGDKPHQTSTSHSRPTPKPAQARKLSCRVLPWRMIYNYLHRTPYPLPSSTLTKIKLITPAPILAIFDVIRLHLIMYE